MDQIDRMTSDMIKFLRSCGDLMKKKNRDYHPEGIPMMEVLRAAAEAHISPQQVLWGHLRKQLSAVRSHVIDRQLKSESIESRLQDVVNYAALFYYLEVNYGKILQDAYAYTIANLPCVCVEFGQPVAPSCDNCILLDWLETESRQWRCVAGQ